MADEQIVWGAFVEIDYGMVAEWRLDAIYATKELALAHFPDADWEHGNSASDGTMYSARGVSMVEPWVVLTEPHPDYQKTWRG